MHRRAHRRDHNSVHKSLHFLVMMQHRAQSLAASAATIPITPAALTQLELLRMNAALPVWDFLLNTGPGSMCSIPQDMNAHVLCYQVKELWKEVSRLFSVRDAKKEIDRVFCKTLYLQKPELQMY